MEKFRYMWVRIWSLKKFSLIYDVKTQEYTLFLPTTLIQLNAN